MPKSKTRKRPSPAPVSPRPPVLPEQAVLAVLRDALQLVKDSEARMAASRMDGQDDAGLLEQHLHLRAAALGLMTTYSQMAGLPDPRSAEIAGKVLG